MRESLVTITTRGV